MAAKKMKKRKKTDRKKWIISAIILAVIGLAAGFAYGQSARHRQKDPIKTEEADIAPAGAMKDGEIVDYEKDGSLALDDYIGIKASVTPAEEDVYRYILTEVEEKKIKVSGEERVKKGDWVLMDYSGAAHGQEVDGLSESGIVIQVGAGNLFNADFERKLTGLLTGQEYTFDVSFPENYFDTDVAGQKITFTVTVSWKFNEAFVKPLSDNKYRTVEEYYEYAKAAERQNNVESLGDTLWDDYLEKCKVKKYPDGSKKQAYQDLKMQYNGIGELSGQSYEEIIADLGMSDEDVRDLAEDEVKGRMVAKTIAAKERLTLTDEQYRSYLYDEVSPDEDEDTSLAALEKSYRETTGSYPRDDMLIQLVKDYIGKNAKQE